MEGESSSSFERDPYYDAIKKKEHLYIIKTNLPKAINLYYK